MKKHTYQTNLIWTGNRGTGTTNYRDYDRDYDIHIMGKPVILGSSDPAFLGDPKRHNPEEQLVAALSSCHLLWYLHLCAEAGVVVIEYEDEASGVMIENENGSGQFSEVTLRPRVRVRKQMMVKQAEVLHEEAHGLCFIARSVNFPVYVEGDVAF